MIRCEQNPSLNRRHTNNRLFLFLRCLQQERGTKNERNGTILIEFLGSFRHMRLLLYVGTEILMRK